MASLENRNGNYRIVLRLDGRKVSRSLKTNDERKAQLALARLEDNLHRLELGTLSIDPDADLVDSLLSTGQPKRIKLKQRSNSIGHLLDDYKNSIPDASLEKTTLGT